MKGRAAVLGGGIQGVCAALALARQGWQVTLFEAAQDCMLRASLRNEGKLHLGFTYAADQSFRTADLMLDSAVCFRAFLDEHLADVIPWHKLISRPFTYLVMEDGLLSKQEVAQHFDKIERGFKDRTVAGGSYLGLEADALWREVPAPAHVNPDAVMGCFETSERALNLDDFREAIASALPGVPGIELRYGHEVQALARSGAGFALSGIAGGAEWKTTADIVVNCLWDQRLPFDREMGLPLPESWTHRLKYRVLAELPDALEDLPALSMLLGPYGDIVPMGKRSYVSWYPVCRKGWSTDLTPPEEWNSACAGSVPPEIVETLSNQVFDALARIVPKMRNASVTQIDAGIVFSRGNTDIDQSDSEFHQRSQVGITHADGYFSVDTGKFVCAPLFAQQLAGMT